MGRSVFETILGAVVLAVAALFLGFAYTSSDLHVVKGYTVAANFPMVDGLKEGIDVKINGVKVGSVAELNLITEPGPTQYLVKIKFTVDPSVRLPSDTIAMVASESLLGGKYLSLEPGVEEDTIKTDGTGILTRTQAPMRLDDLIGQVIYGNKKSEAQHAPEAPAPNAQIPAVLQAPVAAPATPATQAIPTTHP
ncbi:MAG: MlaD family protein [Bdellovibrionales bacterium]